MRQKVYEIKRSIIFFIIIPEREENKCSTERILEEIMDENFPNPAKDTK